MKKFPNASEAFKALNAGLGLSRPVTQSSAQASLGDRASRKASRAARTRLSYCASLVRPLDPDNLAGSTKYCTDALVRSGLLHGDSPEQIEIVWSQKKVAHFDEEKLTITISGCADIAAEVGAAATDESAAEQSKQKEKIT